MYASKPPSHERGRRPSSQPRARSFARPCEGTPAQGRDVRSDVAGVEHVRVRLLGFVAWLLIAGVVCPYALADGDPASDWLLAQSSFLSPFDGHVSPGASDELVGLLAQAQKQGFALKVAVIVTPDDLGSVPELFHENECPRHGGGYLSAPQCYAQFLAEEDYYWWKDELLVVMPSGYGITKSGGLPPGDISVIAHLPWTQTSDGTKLVLAAIRAVRTLADRRDIRLGSATAHPMPSSSSVTERLEIGRAVACAAFIALALALIRRRRTAQPTLSAKLR